MLCESRFCNCACKPLYDDTAAFEYSRTLPMSSPLLLRAIPWPPDPSWNVASKSLVLLPTYATSNDQSLANWYWKPTWNCWTSPFFWCRSTLNRLVPVGTLAGSSAVGLGGPCARVQESNTIFVKGGLRTA